MASIIGRVRRHLAHKELDTLFSIRECLHLGSRAAVDGAFGALVVAGVLERVVRGLYIKPSGKKVTFTNLQIATVKAAAFGKVIFVYGDDAQIELNISSGAGKESSPVTFAINGPSSGFWSEECFIRFKPVCPKYLRFEDSHRGKAIRALVRLGEERCEPHIVARVFGKYNKSERIELRNSAAWMPSWLSDMANFDEDIYIENLYWRPPNNDAGP